MWWWVLAVAIASLAVIAGAASLWWGWILRRRVHWTARLAQTIPVNSKYWRDRKAEPGEITYVAIGDSAAQGIGASRPAHSYVGFIARHLRETFPRSIRVANLSISGGTVRMAIDLELPALRRLEPDVVTVCIGANDIASFDEARFAREIRELFDALPRHAIVATLPSFYFLPDEKKVLTANRLLREAAAANDLTVVDLHRATKRQGLWGPLTQFAGDLFHPNDRGYRLWASVFLPAVDARLAQLR